MSAGFRGPWIENLFIDKFIGKPLSYFGGLIPLFIQWTDIHVHEFVSQGDPNLDKVTYKDLATTNLNYRQYNLSEVFFAFCIVVLQGPL